MTPYDRFERRSAVQHRLDEIINKQVLEFYVAEKPINGLEGPASECVCFVYRDNPNLIVARLYYQNNPPKWRHVERDFVHFVTIIRQGLRGTLSE